MARSTTSNYAIAAALSATIALAVACGGAQQTPPPPTRTNPLQKIVLEIDQMANTPQVPLSVKVGDKEIKLEDLFEPAGIELEIRRDRFDLPHAPEVTLGNLHALMLAHRNQKALNAGEIGVNLLVATRETGRPRDLGVMFDYGDTDTDNYPREGFAVFADVHENLATGRDPELTLTIAHELTHVLNLHHADWEPGQPGGTFDAGSTIESYSTAKDVKWALSERSKQHLLADPAKEKWPGRDNLAFGLALAEHSKRHQSEPFEPNLLIIDASGLNERGRRARVAAEQAARTFQRDRTRVLPIDKSPVLLKLEVPRRTYEVGEPVTVTVGLHNTGKESLYVRPLLDPAYGFLTVEIQLPETTAYVPFRPVLTREARGARAEALAAGGERHDEAKVFFGAGGWTFDKPGTYRIRADFPAPAASESNALTIKDRLQSNTLEITVVAPRTAAGRVASGLLVGIKGGLDLLMGTASEQLQAVVQRGGSSPQADAARIAVVTGVNQTAGSPEQSKVKVEDAVKYLPKTKGAATGPFTVAQAYDQVAEALEKQGKKSEAENVRRQMKVRLAKTEAGAEAVKRVDPKK